MSTARCSVLVSCETHSADGCCPRKDNIYNYLGKEIHLYDRGSNKTRVTYSFEQLFFNIRDCRSSDLTGRSQVWSAEICISSTPAVARADASANWPATRCFLPRSQITCRPLDDNYAQFWRALRKCRRSAPSCEAPRIDSDRSATVL